jgi:hypothetical protein
MIQMSWLEPRPELNATCVPSGDHCGSKFGPSTVVSWFSGPPPTGTVKTWRLAKRSVSNRKVVPSGE